MKKKILLLVGLIIFFSFDVNAWTSIGGQTIPTSTIEGNLFTYSGSLTLTSPKNNTYFNGNSIPLNYSASNSINTWYNLDLGTNVTLTSSIYFGTSDGSHTLYIYSNSSSGLISQNVTFFVNSTKFNIIDNNYEGSKKGDTTNFTILSYEEIQSLNNIILENTNFGKILFSQNINMTADSNFSDIILNLDANVNISSDHIEINSAALPNFNVPATLYLYVTFSNPIILKDGAVCPSSVCTFQSYSGGILVFNVTGFSVYSAEETPTQNGTTIITTPAAPSGGGGGGTVTTPTGEPFSLSIDQLNTKIEQGRIKVQNITITNNENNDLYVNVNFSKISSFINLKEPQFILKSRESRVLEFEISALGSDNPDLYLGEINFQADGKEKTVLTAIEVISAQHLFDVGVEIPSQFLYVVPGKELYSKITLYNLGESGQTVDVNLEYKIMDADGNEILHTTEEVAVNTQMSFVKEFIIPADSKLGKYVLYVKATYDNSVASGSSWFNVGKPTQIPFEWAIIIGAVFIIIAIIANYLNLRKIKKDKIRYKIDETAFRGAGVIKR
jgi:hypothetical protein